MSNAQLRPRRARASGGTARAATTPRALRADATRERLIDVAWKLARREGALALTTRRVALAAGVATGLPFAHFGTRDGLIDELRLRAWDEVDREVEPLRREHEARVPRDHERAVREGLHAIVAFARREPHLYALVAITPGMKLSHAVMLREAASAQRFVQHLFDAQAAGELRFEGDPTVFALALWTSVQGFIQRSLAELEPVFRAYQEQVLDTMLDAFFASVRAPRAGGSA